MKPTLTLLQRSNLARTAMHLLRNWDADRKMIHTSRGRQLSFNMRRYCCQNNRVTSVQDAPSCGTSCCLAGYGRIALNPSKRDSRSWDQFVYETYGVRENSRDWNFLFSQNWPHKPDEAARRVLFYLENGIDPVFDGKLDSRGHYGTDIFQVIDYEDYCYHTDLDDDLVRFRLAAFSLNRAPL